MSLVELRALNLFVSAIALNRLGAVPIVSELVRTRMTKLVEVNGKLNRDILPALTITPGNVESMNAGARRGTTEVERSSWILLLA